MTDLLAELNERIKTLGGDWTKYSAVGSFLLYVAGYLALRFHLTAVGVATDLQVLDERYLFTGARFLFYLLSTVPSIVLLALPLWLLVRIALRLMPPAVAARSAHWLRAPQRLGWIGVLFSVAAIQLVMRQCFYFSNLLVAPSLPAEPAWLVAVLHQTPLQTLYFTLLTALCLVSSALLAPLLATGAAQQPSLGRLRALLAFLVAVQWLMLPVNYGVLVADKSMARVSSAGTRTALEGETAWLVWEGKDSVTFLLRRAEGSRRSLLILPKAQAQPLEVLAFEPIIASLFNLSGEPRLVAPVARR